MKIIQKRKMEAFLSFDDGGLVLTNKKPFINKDKIFIESGGSDDSLYTIGYPLCNELITRLSLRKVSCCRITIQVEEEVECDIIDEEF